MQNSKINIAADIEAISQIPVIPTILEIVCRTTGMGFAAVARVTTEKWIACAVQDEIAFNLKPGGELKLESTICNEIRQHKSPVVINHVALDEHFANHHTPLMYGFQSYISVPIILKNGDFFGTLCAIDPNPAVVNTSTIIGMFNMFADLIAFHLEALKELEKTEKRLQEEREIAELREQFIAILGHDLRNPLNAISNSTQLLARMNQDERVQRLVDIIKNSSFRINGLIENMLDFASGRLGGGIVIFKSLNENIEKSLNQVIAEMKAIKPDREIKTVFSLNHPLHVDEKRIAQLFSNLLGNALNYSPDHSIVEVIATSDAEGFTLCVVNEGKGISKSTLDKLFQPFSRGDVELNKKGLGLGLFIASEIANAHGGSLNVSSSEKQIIFTFNLPVI